MAKLLEGKEVTKILNEQLKARAQALSQGGVSPTLAIVRVGERGDDISYERGATKRCAGIGIDVRPYHLDAGIDTEGLLAVMKEINEDAGIHGCLLLRPLPKHIDEEKVRNALLPQKDIDGITDGSLAGVFTGQNVGFPPCTAQACMEILDFYGVELKGKRAVMLGRSLVVGKPLAMMLLGQNATVTICHTRTSDMPGECKRADILLVAAGRAKMVDQSFLSSGQVVIDVGINVDEGGSLCGDVDFAMAEPLVSMITPVPGGVGTVTTSVLAKHVIIAAERAAGK